MNGVCTVCVSGRAEVAHITLIYEMLPYRVTGKSALAHVELGIEEMHPPPFGCRAPCRVEGEVGVGDRGCVHTN